MQALIIVDVQNDFLPGGALAVPDGDAVVPVINRLQERLPLIVATKDWHPAEHGSFAANHPGGEVGEVVELGGLPQVLWPVHCVQWTGGAEFAPGLDTAAVERVFTKGGDPAVDSYSAFFDNAADRTEAPPTGLDAFLRSRGVERVVICGLATDYCVKLTALDAAALGYGTAVVEDACRAVELEDGDARRAFAELRAAGVEVLRSHELLAEAPQAAMAGA